MFGRSQRAVFKPSVYQPGQRTRRMPRWLVLLLVGIALGAGGVLFLQTNYGPQRLTVEQSEQLHSELSAANLERQRLQTQLEETTQQRDANKTGHEKLTSDLAEARSKIETLNKELVLFQDAMPADPRGGNLGIRSGTFKRAPGQLDYQVLVMREDRQGAPFKGTLTFTIEGTYSNGRAATVTPEGPELNVDRYDYAIGQLKLPDGFTPKVVVLRVMDGAQKQHAMRIYYVRN
ncbi:membrane protein [Achromobacter sp. RTa]|uniref:DUF6776 family protein n=1 Tax=Achromobacter sp. RTa TaxID=1532557 RepID=UPI00050FA9E0|nr:DUF6776 family protein [Achromobacter sp. RTa]KGD98993.1 membrane protein [Achromobacter sp. RTa]